MLKIVRHDGVRIGGGNVVEFVQVIAVLSMAMNPAGARR
jgi:hypothetical protein